MLQTLLKALEKQKEFIEPKVYEKVKKNAHKLPKEVQKNMIDALGKAGRRKKLIDKYYDDREALLTEADKEFDQLEEGLKKQFKEEIKSAEDSEKAKVEKEVDKLINDL